MTDHPSLPEQDRRILIKVVDDEALIAEQLCLSLEELGYRVEEPSYTYVEAEQAIRTGSADLYLLDINLRGTDPARNGLALARQAAEAGKAFIFVTAYDDTDTIRSATSLGPAGYLIKPVNTQTLYATVRTAVERFLKPEREPEEASRVSEEGQSGYFFIKQSSQNVRLHWKDVLWLEAGKNYVTVRMAGGNAPYALRGTLSSIWDTLLPGWLRPDFIRINRQTIVNRAHISRYDGSFVYVNNQALDYSSLNQRQLESLLNQPSVADGDQ